MWRQGLLASLAVVVVLAQTKNYSGHKVVVVTPDNTDQTNVILDLIHQKVIPVDFWRFGSDHFPRFVINVQSIHLPRLRAHLAQHDIHLQVVVDDVQQLIDENMPSDMAKRAPFTADMSPKDFDVSKYHSFDEINAYFKSLAQSNPDVFSVISIGKSTEGRETFVLKIGKKTSDSKKKFMIEAGLHAREWIAPSTAIYIASQLASNSTYDNLISNIDFYILPSANPDGYEYTRSGDRLWRKNRRSFGSCVGVDPNRNFDFKWDPPIHSSDNPCSEQFRGPSALSEKETQNVAKFTRSLNFKFNAYITLHTYGQYMAHSWGYAYNTYPPDKDALLQLSKDAVDALYQVDRHRFATGSSADIVYPASGASDDWAKSEGNQWVYLMELRPDGNSFNGFVLPENNILPAGKETFEAIKVVANKVLSG